jgi:DNA-binding NtrC family response regulator
MSDRPDSNKPRPVVLLLEDEAQLVAALCDNLADEFEIEVATSVEEARLLLGTRRFDLILSDHMLPGKAQGLDFLVEAMSRQPTARRILVTGYMNPELLARGRTLAQLSACLMKPVEMAQLRKVMRAVLAQ